MHDEGISAEVFSFLKTYIEELIQKRIDNVLMQARDLGVSPPYPGVTK